jgi:hypothetical protein
MAMNRICGLISPENFRAQAGNDTLRVALGPRRQGPDAAWGRNAAVIVLDAADDARPVGFNLLEESPTRRN